MEKIESRILISINNLPYNRYEEFVALSFLRDATIDEIWSHHPMVDGYFDPNSMTDEIAVLEPYIAINYFKSQGFKDSQIEVHYDKSYFLHNEKLFTIGDGGAKEIDLSGLLWLSFRESWTHPFYGLIDILLTKKGGKLHKPNKQTMENTGCMNKFYCIKALYPHRAEYLGDIIVPYNISQKHYDTFLAYTKEHLGDRVVFKIDCVQEGGGVSIKDLSDTTSQNSIYTLLNNHKTRNRELFITPLYEIDAEYRVYFTNSDGLRVTGDQQQSTNLKPVAAHPSPITIYSIKKRINTTPLEELLKKENLKIYQNIGVRWELVRHGTDEFINASNKAKEILQHLDYNAGALEFALTPPTDYRSPSTILFEVNQMAGILPFSGEDTKHITEWYFGMLGNGV